MGKPVSATEFKAKCLALIDEMDRSGEPLVITRRGKPSITLTAQRTALPPISDVLGALRGTVAIKGDLDDVLEPDWEQKWLADWDKQIGERQ